jgi:hypothetical protein
VNAEGNSIEKQTVLCTLLGPFILLITLSILLINPVHHFPLTPLVSLFAIAACWQWQMRGLIGALVCLAAIFVYQFLNSAPEAIFWELLLTVSVALTLSITALCSLDVQELFKQHSLESLETTSKLQDFLAMKEKMQWANDKILQVEMDKANEIRLALAEADELQQKLMAQKVLLQKCEEEFSATQEKMRNIISQNENLLRELFQKRHECDKLNRQLEAHEFNELKEVDLSQKLEAQSVLLQARESENAIAQEKIESITIQNENLLRELFQKRHECDKFTNQLESYEQEIKALKAEISLLADAGTPQSVEAVITPEATVELRPAPSSSKRAKGKSSKTNNWANAIMSRWSES